MILGTPRADFIEEAMRLVEAAKARKVVLRVIGALAFSIHCKNFEGLYKALGREFSDIDFVGYYKQRSDLEKLFNDAGYIRRQPSMATAFGKRQIYVDTTHRRIVDVFLDQLIMCHTIDFRNRLEVDYPTVPLAELLLEKMQIVNLTEKDVKDTIVLLRAHEVGDKDQETINSKYIAKLLKDNWGFYYTVTQNLKKIKVFLPNYQVLTKNDRDDITVKVNQILAAIEDEPKTLKWKMRAWVGPTKKWYREVKAIEHDEKEFAC